jgi:hypothetical protein
MIAPIVIRPRRNGRASVIEAMGEKRYALSVTSQSMGGGPGEIEAGNLQRTN